MVNRKGFFWSHREVSPDVLPDLRTYERTLSLWHLTGHNNHQERIIAALASRFKIDDIGYTIIAEESLRCVNLRVEQSKGDSADNEANEKWHYDIVDLTIGDVGKFARVVASTVERSAQRVFASDVREILSEGLKAHRLDFSRFHCQLTKSDKAHFQKIIDGQI